MKKLVSLVLVCTLVLSLVGCGQSGTSNKGNSTSKPSLTAGTYTGVGQGNNGEIKVNVTVDESSIKSIEVVEHAETAGLSDPAFDRIPATIVKNQTLSVDAVAGATNSSKGILTAVEDCIKQAGGSATDFQNEIQKGEAQVETVKTQLVVIGAGAAGMTAAVEAATNGVEVLVLEKGSSVGVSNGSLAGGPIAVNTTVQKEAGEDLTAEELFEYMYGYSQGTVNATLLRNVIERTTKSIKLLEDLGLTLSLRNDNFGIGFRARLKIDEKGVDRMGLLQAVVEENGGTFMFETAGESLVQDKDGNVTGVKAKKADGTIVNVEADAVLVSTGGYLGNDEMMKELYGDNVTVNPLGNTLSTGDGIKMVVDAGGMTERNFGLISNEFAGSNQKAGGWDKQNDNFRLAIYGGLFVNQHGNRFMNEELMATLPLSEGGEAVLREGRYYVVVDAKYIEGISTQGIFSYLGSPSDWIMGKNTLKDKVLNIADTFDKSVEQGWAFRADSLAEVAEHFGLENLEKTVAEYNEMCAAGKDTVYNKSSYFLTPVSEGPYYVYEYEPSAWGTLGGVKVDENLRALDRNNQVINGLYVAGVDAGSMYCLPYYDNEGSALGLALASGTFAGEVISEAINNK